MTDPIPPYTPPAGPSDPELATSAPAPSDPPTGVKSETEKAILAIYARLQNLESSLLDEVKPKLEALEEALMNAARTAAPGLEEKVSEIEKAVASLAGIAVGQPGHDSGAFFHSWWERLRAGFSPQPTAGRVAGTAAIAPAPVVHPL